MPRFTARQFTTGLALSLALGLAIIACNPSSESPTVQETQTTQRPSGEEISRSESTESPNIIIFLADDLGTDKIGAYGEGDDDTRPVTPNIDALAESGILFKNAYSYAQCSPTRASILTGRQAFRTGIGTPVAPNSSYTLQDYPAEVPLPKLFSLANSGYTTAHFGKWHLAIKSHDYDNHPGNIGFDHSSGAFENLDDFYSFDKIVNGVTESVTEYESRDIRNDVTEFIADTSTPWLAYVAFHAPHSPFHEAPSKMISTEITDSSDNTQLYTSAVEAMDTAIGQIVRSLPDNTLILFVGDNGTPGNVTEAPFDGSKAKGTLYEGGVNIPFIVSGYGVDSSQYGSTSTALVHVLDIYRTAAEMAGIDVEANLPDDFVLDSVSFEDVLSDAGSSGGRTSLSVEMFEPNGTDSSEYTSQSRAIRNGRFKLIQDVTNDSVEFYQIENADDGSDGTDLCPCPDNLNGNQTQVYNRLLSQLEAMTY